MRSELASEAQFRLEQFVAPHEQVMALEGLDRVECPEDQTEAGAIHTA